MRPVFWRSLVITVILSEALVAVHGLFKVELDLAVQLGSIETVLFHLLGRQREVGPAAKQFVLQML